MMKDDQITSPQNPRLKAVGQLRTRRGRGRQGLIVIDGRREILRAVEAGLAIKEVFYCTPLLAPGDEQQIMQPAGAAGARLTEVSRGAFAKLCYGDRREGLVATADRPAVGVADLRLGDCPLLGVVEKLEKPGNLGAILRTADGAGVGAVLVADPGTDVYGPNVIRSSLGTVFSVPVVEMSAEGAARWLAERGIAVVAADPGADKVYTEVDFTPPVAVVLGCEAKGLGVVWAEAGVIRARIPMRGAADSLNVSAAAAVLLYEAARQRGLRPA